MLFAPWKTLTKKNNKMFNLELEESVDKTAEYLKDWAIISEAQFGRPGDALKALSHRAENFRKEIISILANKIVYISHPQISSLECTIGLLSCVTLESGHRAEGASIQFEQIADEIETMFNIPFERNRKTFSLTFKDEHAMNCLNKLIGSNTTHPLHSLCDMAISHFLRASQN